MVFSDPIFLLGFLPASILIFNMLRIYVGGLQAVWALLGLSMVFYAYWRLKFSRCFDCSARNIVSHISTNRHSNRYQKRAGKDPTVSQLCAICLLFPQLIAGPIVLHREMGKQVAALRGGGGPGLEPFVPGVLIFVFGLFKRVCLADNIAHYANLTFMFMLGQHFDDAGSMGRFRRKHAAAVF